MGDSVYMSMGSADFEPSPAQEPIPEFANMGPWEHIIDRLADMPVIGAIALAPTIFVAWTLGAIKDKNQEKRSING